MGVSLRGDAIVTTATKLTTPFCLTCQEYAPEWHPSQTKCAGCGVRFGLARCASHNKVSHPTGRVVRGLWTRDSIEFSCEGIPTDAHGHYFTVEGER